MRKRASKVRIILIGILIAALLIGCGSDSAATAPSDSGGAGVEGGADSTENADAVEKSVINVWSWESNEHRRELHEAFYAVYPQYEIQTTLIESLDMPVKVQTALASGMDMPDICWLEINVRGKMFALDCWEVLTEEPYGLDPELLFPTTVELCTNSKGELVGVDGGPAMSALAYKRQLAQEYFGTDDPDEMQQIFTDWDAFIQKGIEVREASGGSVYMFPSLLDPMYILKGQSNEPYIVEGNRLNLTNALLGDFETVVRMKNAGIIDGLEQMSPPWQASIAQLNHIFLPMPDWGPTWIISVNDPDATVQWGLITPPGGGYPWGGTCLSISKTAKNKEGGWDFIQWAYLSIEGAEAGRDLMGNITPLKELYDPALRFFSNRHPAFGGQDVLEYLTTVVAPTVEATRQVNEYDAEIYDALQLALTTLNGSNGDITAEQCIQVMEDDLLNKIPELTA